MGKVFLGALLVKSCPSPTAGELLIAKWVVNAELHWHLFSCHLTS
jgi:hypothetical protein